MLASKLKYYLKALFLFLLSYGWGQECSYHEYECVILKELLILNDPVINPGSPNINLSEQDEDGLFTYFGLLDYTTDQFGIQIPAIVEDPNCLAGETCRITEINFSGFGIHTLPDNFGHNIFGIVDLQSLELRNNQLTELPSSFSNLDELSYLDLKNNDINSLPDGFSGLTLTYLDLGYNNISQLPQDFGSMITLEHLDLTENNILDFNYSSFENLAILYLQGNRISQFPEDLCDMNINWGGFTFTVEDNHLCSNLPDCLNNSGIYGDQDCNEEQIQYIEELISTNGLDENSSLNDNDDQDNYFKYNEVGYQVWELGNIKELYLGTHPQTNLQLNYQLNSLPYNLGDLNSLKILELQNNSLISIPSSIGEIDSLLMLNLFNNSITSNGSQGGIPDNIANLDYLEILKLGQNQITLPNEAIYQITSLKELHLENNNILYLDSDIGNLTQLTYLSVSENNLTNFPNTISNLNLLEELWASNNNLFTFSDGLQSMTELVQLDLGNNSIPTIPTFIHNYNDLQSLYLNNNQISVLPTELFSLSELKKLHLEYNYLSVIPSQIGALDNLEELYLQFNEIYELPSSVCNIDINYSLSAEEISQDLQLHQNYFCFNLPYCIENHDDTQEVIGEQNCYGSDLSVVQSILDMNGINEAAVNVGEWDPFIERLVGLDLSATALLYLGFENDVITQLPTNLGHLAELKYLDFSGNQIEEIPSSIEYMIRLDSLKLSGNLLTSLPSEISSLQELELLDISENNFSSMPTNFHTLVNLRYLNLNQNSIEDLHHNLFLLDNLEYLDLSNNEIIELQSQIGNLNSLKSLNVKKNNLTTFPNEFSQLSNLEFFNADSNAIDSIPPIIDDLDNLTDLHLSGNQLVELDGEFFNGYSLTTVNLKSNRLLWLPESVCNSQSIELVDVTGNYLYCINYYDSEIDEWNGAQNTLSIPDCIAEIPDTILVGLEDDIGNCVNYGCTDETALNYESNYEMSCSSDGTVEHLNDCCNFVQGPIIYVSSNGSNVSGQGTLEFPFGTIQKALQLAGEDYIVQVAPGRYYENIVISNKQSLVLVSEAFNFESDVMKKSMMDSTIIDGEADSSCVLIESSGELEDIFIYGFTFQNGQSQSGGGIKIADSDVKIEHSRIYNNLSLSGNGGGLHISGNSNVNVVNTIIESNRAPIVPGNGGGIFIELNSNENLVRFDNVEFLRNRSINGGGIYMEANGLLEFDNCLIHRNVTIDKGGGLFSKSDHLLFHSRIDEIDGILDTIYTRIQEDTAETGSGGGIYIENANTDIKGILLSGNHASVDGGAIYAENSYAQYDNLIIKNNSAGSGAALFTNSSVLDLNHCTITQNQASDGTGIYLNNQSNIDFTNSISWDNGESEFGLESSTINIQYSLTETEFSGNNNQNENPEFEDSRFYNLTRVSKAIGSGMSVENTELPEFDFFGMVSRNQGSIMPDLGAIESTYDSTTYLPWYVWDIDYTVEDGTEEEPFKTINQAINIALNGDTIYVKNGEYTENLSFSGKKLSLYSKYLQPQDVTILGDGNGSVVSIAEGDEIEISGFTISGGDAEYGGGLSVVNSSPSIHLSDLIIQDNFADFGGGIYLENFVGVLEDVLIANNIAEQKGAGIYVQNSSPEMNRLEIHNNKEKIWTYALSGGGICLNNSSPQSFENINFLNNQASVNGGALSLMGDSYLTTTGTLTFDQNIALGNGGALSVKDSEFHSTGITKLTFHDNSSVQKGGALFIDAGTVEIENVEFNANNAESGGAIGIIDHGAAQINSGWLKDNSANYQGGALYLNGDNTSLELTRFEIWGNGADQAGILYSNKGSILLQNTMVAQNHSINYPGGVLAKNTDLSLINVTMTDNVVNETGFGGNLNLERDSRLKIINSILWENTGREVYLRDDGPVKSAYTAHSVIRDGELGVIRSDWDTLVYHESNFEENPLFISPDDGYYYVSKQSPCVDTGTDSIVVWGELISIPESELIDGNGDGIPAIDIGAYEKKVINVFPGDLNKDGIVDTGDIKNIVCNFHVSGIPRYRQYYHWDQSDSTEFTGYGAIAWNDREEISGEALTHIDANGDGLIEEKDVLGIGVNWGRSHYYGSQEFVNNQCFEENSPSMFRDQLMSIYNSATGNGEGFDEIRSYIENLLGFEPIPTKFSLYQNYPNPFNPETTVKFDLPVDSFVTLTVYDLTGRKVNTILNNSFLRAGQRKINIDGRRLPSGMYLLRIKAGHYNSGIKMMLLK